MALLQTSPSGSPEVYLEEPRLSDPGLGVRTYGRTYVRTYVGGLPYRVYRVTPEKSENNDQFKRADGSVKHGPANDRALPATGNGARTPLGVPKTPPGNLDPAKTATESAAEESEAR